MIILKKYFLTGLLIKCNGYLFLKFANIKLSFKHRLISYPHIAFLFLYNLPNNLSQILLWNRKDKVTGDFVVDNLRKDYK